MRQSEDRERELTAEDRRMIAVIDAALRPAPMSPVRRARFRAGLDERLARRARPWRWLAPALASAAAVSVWLAQPDATPPSRTAAAGSEIYAFIDPDSAPGAPPESESYLPEDYQAIAALIEGGEGEL